MMKQSKEDINANIFFDFKNAQVQVSQVNESQFQSLKWIFRIVKLMIVQIHFWLEPLQAVLTISKLKVLMLPSRGESQLKVW